MGSALVSSSCPAPTSGRTFRARLHHGAHPAFLTSARNAVIAADFVALRRVLAITPFRRRRRRPGVAFRFRSPNGVKRVEQGPALSVVSRLGTRLIDGRKQNELNALPPRGSIPFRNPTAQLDLERGQQIDDEGHRARTNGLSPPAGAPGGSRWCSSNDHAPADPATKRHNDGFVQRRRGPEFRRNSIGKGLAGRTW